MHVQVCFSQAYCRTTNPTRFKSHEALARLYSETARKQLLSREQSWRQMGVNSVPTMIFNNTTWVKGAQQVLSYKELFEDLQKTTRDSYSVVTVNREN